jgi:hypothetical protein
MYFTMFDSFVQLPALGVNYVVIEVRMLVVVNVTRSKCCVINKCVWVRRLSSKMLCQHGIVREQNVSKLEIEVY